MSAPQTRIEWTGNIQVHHPVKEEPCDCEFIDVMGPGYPLMRMAMAHCPQHGHDPDCEGCVYCRAVPILYPAA